MSAFVAGSFDAMPRSHFGRALGIALLLEILAVGVWLLHGYFMPQPAPGLRRAPIQIHMVILAPHPKPIVRPRPKPVVKPRPHIVHHVVPIPRPVPKKPVARSKPLPKQPPPPMPVASPEQAATAVDRYAVMIRTRIQKGLRVPAAVRALGLSGRAVIAFKLTPRGRLLWARVARSSGFGPIDRACLAAVQERLYPPFTKHMPHHALRFDVTVSLHDQNQY